MITIGKLNLMLALYFYPLLSNALLTNTNKKLELKIIEIIEEIRTNQNLSESEVIDLKKIENSQIEKIGEIIISLFFPEEQYHELSEDTYREITLDIGNIFLFHYQKIEKDKYDRYEKFENRIHAPYHLFQWNN